MPSSVVRYAPAGTLFLASPLIGEFLLGNISIDLIWLLAALAPLYGAAALLIRELARRWESGWLGVFLLGVAYALFEEGLLTQSLFDADYLGLRLLDYGYIPSLGMGAWWTVFVIGLHTIWSVAAAIGLAQALWPARAGDSWLPGRALPLTLAIFVCGCVATAWLDGGPRRTATAQQVVATLATVGMLLMAARHLGRRDRAPAREPQAPRPRVAGLTAFTLLTLFMMSSWSMNSIPAAWCVAWMLTTLGVLAACIRRWSSRSGWDMRHDLALVAGALGTYAWWSLTLPATVSSAGLFVDTVGNAIFIALALSALCVARRRITPEAS